MKVNILVIDNEERISFSRFLAAEGHNVITAKGYIGYLVEPLKQGGLINSVIMGLHNRQNGGSIRESCFTVALTDRGSKRQDFGRKERW